MTTSGLEYAETVPPGSFTRAVTDVGLDAVPPTANAALNRTRLPNVYAFNVTAPPIGPGSEADKRGVAYSYTQGLALTGNALMVALRNYLRDTVGLTVVQDTVTTGASGQYCVFSTTGESATEITTYLRILRASGTIQFITYIYWASGSGNKANGSTSGTSGTGTWIPADDTAGLLEYWFFGSKDRVMAFVASPATQVGNRCGIYMGFYTRQRSASYATVSGALTAGSNVVATVDTSTPFVVEQRYIITDAAGAMAQFETAKITAKDATHVTFETLQNSYLTGARIGEDPRPIVVSLSGGGLPIGSMWHGTPYGRTAPFNMAPLQTLPTSLIDQVNPERNAPGGPIVNLYPYFVSERSFGLSGLLGTLIGVYAIGRADMAQDDTINVGSDVYHMMTLAMSDTASSAALGGLAVRRQ